MKSNESSEDYLETILILSGKLPVVRSVDIANELGFKKSSVSVAMKKLREQGHITTTDAGYIFLTETGKEIADKVYERHTLFTDFFVKLGVDEETAENDAWRIEYLSSDRIYETWRESICRNS